METEHVQKVSERSVTLSKWIKEPMILLTMSAVITNSASIALIKASDTILQEGNFSSYWVQFFFMCTYAMWLGIAGLSALN